MFVCGRFCAMTVVLLEMGVSLATGAEPGMVAYYRFDEGAGVLAKDVSGRGNHGTIHGGKFVKRGEGFALELDGEGDYIETAAARAARCAISSPTSPQRTRGPSNCGSGRADGRAAWSIGARAALGRTSGSRLRSTRTTGKRRTPSSW